ncbi:hypothetical protein WKH46_05920 [Pantoea agglomerans]|uniref:hypothetical protein n=1 Tax=Enterobacter agglomerans TaxID=549 RepID=UPI003C7B177D
MSWMKLSGGINQVILTEYSLDVKEGDSRAVYLVRHNSKIWNTTLEQNITVERDSYGAFKPTIAMQDFPRGLSERESMLKLADWLHRLGVSIEDHWSKP